MDPTTQSTLKRLWQVANSPHGADTPDLTSLLAQIAGGAIEGLLTADLIGELLESPSPRRHAGHFYSANSVSRFFAALAAGRDVTSILDPTCGSGLLLQRVADATNAEVIHGVETVTAVHSIAAALLGERATIYNGNFLDVQDRLADRYDLIVGDLPLGLRIPEQRRTNNGGARVRELAEAIVYWSCDHLREGGLAVLNVSNRLVADDQVRNQINTMGYAVTGAIQVPSGVMLNTHLSTHLLLIEPGEQGDIFAARLPETEVQTESVVQNWRRKRRTGHPSLGSMVKPSDFYGYAAVEAANLGREQLRGSTYKPFAAQDVFLDPPQRLDPNPDERPELEHGEAVIDFAGRVSLTDDASPTSSNAYRVRLNPELVDPVFFQKWMQSDLAKLALVSVSPGSTRRLVSVRVLLAATYSLPDLPTQEAIAGIDRRLDVLSTQIAQTRKLVWEGRTPTHDLESRLEQINHGDEDLFWLETLPYPLASILWRYRTAEKSPVLRVPILEHFFEALAAFLSTVHLSAYLSDEDEWSVVQPSVLAGLNRANTTLERATFGTWKTTYSTLAKATREMLGDEERKRLAFELYHSHDKSFIEAISSPKLATVFDQANALRNQFIGHGGAMGDAGAAEIEAQFLDLLQDVRSTLGLCWRTSELVQPGTSSFRDGEHIYQMPRLMGTRSGFERVQRATTSPMESGSLHLIGRGEAAALKLVPFFRMAASHSPNACYFFNRCEERGVRFVSYHDEQSPELVESFGDTMQAIHRITTTPALPGMEETL